MKVFHTSVSWWFLTGVWVTSNLQDFRNILADLNNTVFSMFYSCPHTYNSSSPCTDPLVNIQSSPVKIGITVTVMFHNFFSSPGRSRYYYYYYYLFIRVFHTSVSWWYFTRDWVTASLLKSPGLFSVFWAFSIMLLLGWSPLARQLLNLSGPLIIVLLPCQKHQSQLI